MTSRYLFVYGTLKRRSRHPMAAHLAKSATFVGEATIAGRLYNLGRFPGLKEPRSFEDRVHGDVYDLGDNADAVLREMDAYENAESPPPTPYERELATVRLADGRELEVWVYWYRGEVDEANLIASGSFELNCDPVNYDPALTRQVGIFSLAGGVTGLLLTVVFVPVVILAECSLDQRDPVTAFKNDHLMAELFFFGLKAFPIPGLIAGYLAAFLPRKYQQTISLVSFGTSIFGTISFFVNAVVLPHRPWMSWVFVIAIFLALGALYGFFLSVSVRILDRVFRNKDLRRRIMNERMNFEQEPRTK